MIITLITPSFGEKMAYAHMEPLTMAVLASFIPPGNVVRFFDDRIEDVPFDESTDLVAISVETFTARRAYQIADAFRKKGTRVVLGGFHVTLVPGEAQQHADAIVVGEAEHTWPQVIRDAAAGTMEKVYRSAGPIDLAGTVPNRSIFKGKRYVPIGLVEFGRGCKFACDFCSVHTFFGSRRVTRPVEDVIRDIQATHRKYILIIDDNVVSDRQKATKLFRALVPLKIKWIGQASIDIVDDDEMLNLIADSGCFGLLLGFESLSMDTIRQIRKGANRSLDQYDDLTRKLHSRNVRICASFLFGYDFDSQESFDRVIRFVNSQKYLLAQFNHLTPFPGTALYKRLEHEGRLLNPAWWLENVRWGDVFFLPKQLTPAQLSEGCRDCRKRYFRLRGMLCRFLLPANLRFPLLYWAINVLVAKSVRKKQGFELGAASARKQESE